MRELSLHLLDIAENSISAGAKRVRIVVNENSNTDLLQMIVEDDGRGMSPEMVATVVDPFVTTRTTRKVGLGIPLLKAAAEDCNGYLEVRSSPGRGTTITVSFQRSHIDRMPLGDLESTILHLVIANPQIHWIFEYWYNDAVFTFNDLPIKQELGDIPMTEPGILNCLREMIESGIRGVNPDFTPDHVYLQL